MEEPTDLATSAKARLSKREWGLWGVALIVGLFVIYLVPISQSPSEPRVDTALFELTDQGGQQFDQNRVSERPYLVFFGFNNCVDVCPTTLQRLTLLRRELGISPDQLGIVYVSTDPDRDDPKGMREFLAQFDHPIMGLTGTRDQIFMAQNQFRVVAKKIETDDDNYGVLHSSTVFLMDENGGIFSTIEPEETQEIARLKVRALMEGPPQTAGSEGAETNSS